MKPPLTTRSRLNRVAPKSSFILRLFPINVNKENFNTLEYLTLFLFEKLNRVKLLADDKLWSRFHWLIDWRTERCLYLSLFHSFSTSYFILLLDAAANTQPTGRYPAIYLPTYLPSEKIHHQTPPLKQPNSRRKRKRCLENHPPQQKQHPARPTQLPSLLLPRRRRHTPSMDNPRQTRISKQQSNNSKREPKGEWASKYASPFLLLLKNYTTQAKHPGRMKKKINIKKKLS